jgi:hypothetical protein
VCLSIVALGFIALAKSAITFGNVYACGPGYPPAKDVFWVNPVSGQSEQVYAHVAGTGSNSPYLIYVVQSVPTAGEELTDCSGGPYPKNQLGTFLIWENPTEGSYSVVLDQNGDGTYNFEEHLYSFTVQSDANSPEISITYPPDDGWVKGTVTVSGISSDSESGVQKVRLNVDGEDFPDAEGTLSWSATISLLDGSHTIIAEAVDNAGNTQTTSVTFNVDTEAPTVTITSPIAGFYQTSTLPAEVEYTVTDNLDSNPTVEVIGWFTDEGVHTVTVTATDIAGNVGSDSVQYTVDDTPPEGTILINGDEPYTNSASVTLTLTYSDATSGVNAVRYSNDDTFAGAGWESPSTTKTGELTSGDGEKTVYYQIKDNAGLISQTYSDTITLNTVSPTGSISINDDAEYTSSTSVELTLTYDPLDISEVRYSNDENWDIVSWEAPSTLKSWTLTIGDGPKTVYYQIKNTAGSVSTYQDSITLDTEPPSGAITINSGASVTTSTSVTLTLDYSDATSDVDQVRYSNDGTWDTEGWEVPAETKLWILSPDEGQKTVYYQIRDNAGLLSATYSGNIILSYGASTGSISINNGDDYTTSINVDLTLTYNDPLGISGVRYSNDGEWDTEIWEAPSASKTWTLSAGDGEKTVYYQVKNTAELVSPTYSDNIILDTEAPIGTVTISEGAITNQLIVSLTLTASDSTSGVSQMRLSTDGTFDTEPWEPFSTTTSWNLLDGDGDKTIYVQFKDNAELVSETYTASILLDTSPPSTPTPDVPAGWINDDAPTLTWSASDDDGSGVAGYYYRVDGESETWTISTSVTLPSQSDGSHVFYVKARDNAWNIGTESSFEFHIDTTPPSVTISSPAEGETTQSSSITVVWSGSDAGSGVDWYEVRLDSGSWIYKATSSSHTFTGLSEGSHTVYIRAVDNVGNSQEYPRGFSVGAAPQYTLTVSSAYGTPTPAVGVHVYNFGVSVNCSVVSSVTVNGTVWTCTGWTGTGAVPSSGTGTSATVIMTQDSTITWIWHENKPPTGSISISGGATYATSASVTLTATYDANITQVRYSNDGVWDTEVWENVATTKTWNLAAGDGTKTVYCQFRDALGVNSAVYSDTITLDTTPPTGSISINANAAETNSTSVNLTLAANDANGVAQMRFSNDQTTWSNWEEYNTEKAWTLTSGFETKTVYVQFQDNAGLVSSSYADTISLVSSQPSSSPPSSTPTTPETPASPDTSAKPSTGKLIVIVKGTDNNAVEGATVTSTSQPAGQNALQGKTDSTGTVTFDNIKAGSYSIQVSKAEAEGTPQTAVVTSQETTTITFTLQSEAQHPAVSVNLKPANSATNQPWVFTIVAGNDVANVTLYIDGNPVETWTAAGTYTYAGDAYSTGTHTYFVDAYDNNGNRIREPASENLQFIVEAPKAIELWKILSVITVLACGTGLLFVAFKPKKTENT